MYCIPVPPRQHLCDCPTHRIADHDGSSDRKLANKRGEVVRTCLDAERWCTAALSAVPAQIWRYDVEGTTEEIEGTVPVECRSRHPAVQQKHSGSTWRSLDLPGPGADASCRADDPALGPGCDGAIGF